MLGDTREVLASLEPASVDLVLSSRPFFALRSYLASDDPAAPHRGAGVVTAGVFAESHRRVVCWFSAGAASAVATKLTLAARPDAVVAYVDTGSEHRDNVRFRADCAAWFGTTIVTLRSDKYDSTWDVWEQRRFLVSPQGALCTAELKKKVRFAFERPDDIQVFGYTADGPDRQRASRFREQNPGVTLVAPLIDRELTKSDCLAMIDRAGIEVPAMYRLGYRNNNCIGCVKGGMGYWNKIRRDFPDVFARMASLEERIGATVLREPDTGARLPLRALAPDRGDHADEPEMECSLACALAEHELEDKS